ncbi:hypothetical protein [Burkholderia ubonensis]|uniref:hypothetical protein n=1 Tax=Burkholderia ubonensis TaxID=101571 RepID=UPI00075D4C69|nr:hypothetical protein WM23_20695 [Burkholderia ubonensis]
MTVSARTTDPATWLAMVSVGLHYGENSRIVPQLQINVTPKGADQGALADTNNTAGTIVTRA